MSLASLAVTAPPALGRAAGGGAVTHGDESSGSDPSPISIAILACNAIAAIASHNQLPTRTRHVDPGDLDPKAPRPGTAEQPRMSRVIPNGRSVP